MLRKIGPSDANCLDGETCPALYEDDGRYVVQGHIIDASTEGIALGSGEVAIEVPKNILDVLRKL